MNKLHCVHSLHTHQIRPQGVWHFTLFSYEPFIVGETQGKEVYRVQSNGRLGCDVVAVTDDSAAMGSGSAAAPEPYGTCDNHRFSTLCARCIHAVGVNLMITGGPKQHTAATP